MHTKGSDMKKVIVSILLIIGTGLSVQAQEIRADVIKVTTAKSGAGYRFNVTLRSDETGCAQYADWWEVLDSKGKLLYRRILFHSHPNDQPFTRSGGSVTLDSDDVVYIRGHMNTLGYVGDLFVGSVAKGFKKAEKVPVFPKNLESQKPLPDGCAFERLVKYK